MLPPDKLTRISPHKELWTGLMDRDGVNQLHVVTRSQVIGMLSREDVITFLRAVHEPGASSVHDPTIGHVQIG